MIKISANVSKKVPLPGVDYSSQQFGAAMEIEVSDADQPEVVRLRIQELYALLSDTIDQQISNTAQSAPRNVPARLPVRQAPNRLAAPQNGVQNGSHRRPAANGRTNRIVTATDAQQRAIFAICNSLNLELQAVLAVYNVGDASQLTVKDASRLIDELKRQNGNGSTPRA